MLLNYLNSLKLVAKSALPSRISRGTGFLDHDNGDHDHDGNNESKEFSFIGYMYALGSKKKPRALRTRRSNSSYGFEMIDTIVDNQDAHENPNHSSIDTRTIDPVTIDETNGENIDSAPLARPSLYLKRQRSRSCDFEENDLGRPSL